MGETKTMSRQEIMRMLRKELYRLANSDGNSTIQSAHQFVCFASDRRLWSLINECPGTKDDENNDVIETTVLFHFIAEHYDSINIGKSSSAVAFTKTPRPDELPCETPIIGEMLLSFLPPLERDDAIGDLETHFRGQVKRFRKHKFGLFAARLGYFCGVVGIYARRRPGVLMEVVKTIFKVGVSG